MPGCIAIGCLDLARGSVLAMDGQDAGEMEKIELVAAAVCEVLREDGVDELTEIFRKARGLTADEVTPFREYLVVAADGTYFAQRSRTRPNLALLSVHAGAVNLGLVMTRTRGVLPVVEEAA